MKITKQTNSIIQGIQFSTIREMSDYIVITCPIGMSIEIRDNFIHIRNLNDKPKAIPSGNENENN